MNAPRVRELEIRSGNVGSFAPRETVGEIPVFNKSLTYGEFFEGFMRRNEPCLINNLSDDWNVNKLWIKGDSLDLDYFRERCKNSKVPISDCGKREFNVQKKFTMDLHGYLNYWVSRKGSSSPSTHLLYLKDWHFFREYPEERVYEVPMYFASDWLNEYYDGLPELKDDYKFVYIGPEGSWTPFHADVFTSFSWSVNVCGRKKWILMPPGAEKRFTDNLGNLTYDVDLKSLHNEEGICNVPYFCVHQEKGQGLFVPSGWHHQVWNLVDTVSINHNWINGCNIRLVWESLKKSLGEVKKEISDCRDMENWSTQCQVLLSSTFGMDYRFFHSFLTHIVKARLRAFKNDEKISVFNSNWILGRKHVEFDLRKALTVLNCLEKDDDFIETTNCDENSLNDHFECLDSLNVFTNDENE